MRRVNKALALFRVWFLLWFLGGLFIPLPAVLSSDEAATSAPSRAKELRERWDRLDQKKKETLLQRYRQWKRLTPQKRATVRRNLERFRSLPEAERNKIRKNYRRFQKLPAHKKRIILKNYKRWQKMGPMEKQRLRERYKQNFQRQAPPRGSLNQGLQNQ